jgi:hypothetical protein
MNCNERIGELVECARRQTKPDRELLAHLSQCTVCGKRWEAEIHLTGEIRTMRAQTDGLRSPDMRRESLMLEFSRRHPLKTSQSPFRSWVWALGAAAAVVLVLIGIQTKRTHNVQIADTALYESSAFLSGSFLSSDASALSSDEFIAVPYTPPLAPGEMVRMIHADVYPEALATMGLDVDPSWGGDLPVDVVVGEDGLPRAVRITGNNQF